MDVGQEELIWLPTPLFINYEVSSAGHVRRIGKQAQLSVQIDKDGYFRVYNKPVHRLVCSAFHGLPSRDKPMALHYDGTKTNNVPSNLYWGDYQDNSDDRARHGNDCNKWKVGDKANEIRELAKTMSQTQVGMIYGIDQTTVSIIVGKRRGYKEYTP